MHFHCLIRQSCQLRVTMYCGPCSHFCHQQPTFVENANKYRTEWLYELRKEFKFTGFHQMQPTSMSQKHVSFVSHWIGNVDVIEEYPKNTQACVFFIVHSFVYRKCRGIFCPQSIQQMALRELHLHLLVHARTYSSQVGNRQLRRWSRADEVHTIAVEFLRRFPRVNNTDLNRLALIACQDLVRLKLITIEQACGYRAFSKRSGCLVYLHNKSRPANTLLHSGLRWI